MTAALRPLSSGRLMVSWSSSTPAAGADVAITDPQVTDAQVFERPAGGVATLTARTTDGRSP
ncbi:hypothetical protein [Marinitenerispora sediminis]|uniref:Uncharacterized protein n=1 Tax=Marinitenerispora sediminis TaxID=1931232 RepID=A0A368T016_9ACTN|nr:hypothetical protein [Marinitenerispora sediminis]RCV49129.1 hypothetical protein DEF28_21765 [Marinitenerispora sediminis]RCV51877.1 hypothetical protein DEF24_22690 [Marinitenerispora sediminis]RCV57236.1 hypothetical protein DEF23_11130 [Marinitenerispora sediminis]